MYKRYINSIIIIIIIIIIIFIIIIIIIIIKAEGRNSPHLNLCL